MAADTALVACGKEGGPPGQGPRPDELEVTGKPFSREPLLPDGRPPGPLGTKGQ